MKARIILMYGLGGAAIEWWSTGQRLFQQRLEKIGMETLLIDWNQRQEAYNFMNGFVGWRGYTGDSLGAGSAAQYPGDVSGPVNFAAGFQPSMDDTRASDGKIVVAANVIRAHCIHDPVWADTLGLGQAKYVQAPGAKTIVMVTEHSGAHPDDWGYSQDMIFAEIEGQVQNANA